MTTAAEAVHSEHRRTTAAAIPVASAGRLIAALTALAAVLDAWGLASAPANSYYASIVRSMSTSWHNFLYGAADPNGFISADKLPGAFWIQSLSVRTFGFHPWAIALPGVLAATASVPLLYVLVRRWAGRNAGLLAALVLTITPITVAVARVDLPDNFLVLFLLLSLHSFWAALETGRLRPLLASAAWLGAGFNMKMIVALILLPVLLGVYLIAAPGPLGRRVGRAVGHVLVTAAVSLPWLVVVSLTPAADRPYLDGSTHNSVWQMIFSYDGFGRVDNATGFGAASSNAASALVTPRFAGAAGSGRLANAELGGQIGWLIPLALLALVIGLLATRRAARIDRDRAGWLIWGGWLLAYAVAFSDAPGTHPYYTIVLAPAIGALVGAGVIRFATKRSASAAPSLAPIVPVVIALAGSWEFVLLSRSPHYLPWLRILVLAGTIIGTLLSLALVLASRNRTTANARSPLMLRVTAAAAAIALLAAPAVWSLTPLARDSSVNPVAGPTPVYTAFFAQIDAMPGIPAGGIPPAMIASLETQLNGNGNTADPQLTAYLLAHHDGQKYVVAIAGALNAAPYIELGLPVLPIGGFSAQIPSPTLAQLATFVQDGQLRYMLLTSSTLNGGSPQIIAWAHAHCTPVNLAPQGAYPSAGNSAAASFMAALIPVLYDCGNK